MLFGVPVHVQKSVYLGSTGSTLYFYVLPSKCNITNDLAVDSTLGLNHSAQLILEGSE